MSDVLDEAKEVLAKWKRNKPKVSQKWEERRMANIESWESMRPVLMENVLQGYAIQSTNCHLCSNTQAVIKCHDCSQTKLLCEICDTTVHAELPLHDRQGAINGFYQAISPIVAFDSTCTNLVNISKY